MLTERELTRAEVPLVWSIDRSEVIDNFYHLENGVLVQRPNRVEVTGWPPGEAEKYTPILFEYFDRGGWFHGSFEDDRLVGAVVLDSKFIGRTRNKLQLEFLHVSRLWRGRGLGAHLFELAKERARGRGARRLYISATPSGNTIDFYLRLGCEVSSDIDPDLFALEPEDIHLECEL